MLLNLIVFGVSMHKAEQFMDTVASTTWPILWQRETLFGTSLIVIGEVNADSLLATFLLHQDQVGKPFGVVSL